MSEATHLTETVRLAAADGSGARESASISARWSSMPPLGRALLLELAAHDRAEREPAGPAEPRRPREPAGHLHAERGSGAAGSLAQVLPALLRLPRDLAGRQEDGADHRRLGRAERVAVRADGRGHQAGRLERRRRRPFASRPTTRPSRASRSSARSHPTGCTSCSRSRASSCPGRPTRRSPTRARPCSPALGTDSALTMPFWSAKGDLFSFVGYTPAGSPQYDTGDLNGNETVGAQIWTAPVTGRPSALRSCSSPRVSGASEYYPAISDDSALVAFNESSCAGPELAGRRRVRAEPVRRLRRPFGAPAPRRGVAEAPPSSSIARAAARRSGPRAAPGRTRGRAGRRRTAPSRARPSTGSPSRHAARTAPRCPAPRTARRSRSSGSRPSRSPPDRRALGRPELRARVPSAAEQRPSGAAGRRRAVGRIRRGRRRPEGQSCSAVGREVRADHAGDPEVKRFSRGWAEAEAAGSSSGRKSMD